MSMEHIGNNRPADEPCWASIDGQHPRGVPVIRNDRYWLYGEEQEDGWHITGVRENGENGLQEVHIPAALEGRPVRAVHMDWTRDPEHPDYVGWLYLPDCIPGVEGRGLRYVLHVKLEETAHPCLKARENLLLTPDGRRVVAAMVRYQRYFFVPAEVEVIGEGAFFGSMTDRVFLPKGLQEIEPCAFQDARRLRSVVIPEGVTRVGTLAFAGSAIEAAILPESIEVLDYGAFAGSSLLEITIPPRVRTLEGTFMYCTDLRRVHLSEGLAEIGAYTFQTCENLMQITLPASVRTVDAEAFAECEAEVVRG